MKKTKRILERIRYFYVNRLQKQGLLRFMEEVFWLVDASRGVFMKKEPVDLGERFDLVFLKTTVLFL